MALDGFRKSCIGIRGGIETIALIDAKDVVSVLYDAEMDCYINIGIRTGAGFVRFGFAEDQALYSERIDPKTGLHVVKHTLQFTLKGMNSPTRCAVEGLMRARDGVVALAEGRQGEWLLIGWSEKFAAEQALRIGKTNGTTQSAPGEPPTETITLTASDTEKAKPFVGEIPWKS